MSSKNQNPAGNVGGGAGAVKRRKGKAAAGVATVATVQPSSVQPLPLVVWQKPFTLAAMLAKERRRQAALLPSPWWFRPAVQPATVQPLPVVQSEPGAGAWVLVRVRWVAGFADMIPQAWPCESSSVQPATVGGGSLAAGLAAFNPARVASAVECQSVGDLLRGCERPAGPMLRAVQLAGDLALVQALAHRLNRKMFGEGRANSFTRDESSGAAFGAFDWLVSMREACNDATAKLVMYRAGYGLTRDIQSGGDMLTVGDDLGNVCGAWLKGFGRGFKGSSKGQAGYRFFSSSSRIVWRALTDSIKTDNMGQSEATQAAAADWYSWAAMCGGDWSQLISGVQVEQAQAWRLECLDTLFEAMAAGRGRAKAFASKAKQATINMLAGMGGEQALLAAGFKGGKGSRGSGDMSACNVFAGQLRRKGYQVVSKRGNFKQDSRECENLQAAQKRGATLGGDGVFSSGDFEWDYVPLRAVSRECPAVQPLPLWYGRKCGRGCVAAAMVRAGGRSGASLMRSAKRERVATVQPATVQSYNLFTGDAAAAMVRAGKVKGVAVQVERASAVYAWQAAASLRFASSPNKRAKVWAAVRRYGVQPATVATVQPSSVQPATVQPLPLLPAQVRRIVAAGERRKLQGVLRSTPLPSAIVQRGRQIVERQAFQARRFVGAMFIATL